MQQIDGLLAILSAIENQDANHPLMAEIERAVLDGGLDADEEMCLQTCYSCMTTTTSPPSPAAAAAPRNRLVFSRTLGRLNAYWDTEQANNPYKDGTVENICWNDCVANKASSVDQCTAMVDGMQCAEQCDKWSSGEMSCQALSDLFGVADYQKECNSCIDNDPDQSHVWCTVDQSCYNVNDAAADSGCKDGPGNGFTHQGNCIGKIETTAPPEKGGDGPVCIENTCNMFPRCMPEEAQQWWKEHCEGITPQPSSSPPLCASDTPQFMKTCSDCTQCKNAMKYGGIDLDALCCCQSDTPNEGRNLMHPMSQRCLVKFSPDITAEQYEGLSSHFLDVSKSGCAWIPAGGSSYENCSLIPGALQSIVGSLVETVAFCDKGWINPIPPPPPHYEPPAVPSVCVSPPL